MIELLPYSAFPAALAGHVGALTVAYQRIEDEVLTLTGELISAEPAITNLLMERIGSIGARLTLIQKLCELLNDPEEISRLKALTQKVTDVSRQRNEFVHSITTACNKHTGDLLHINRKKGPEPGAHKTVSPN